MLYNNMNCIIPIVCMYFLNLKINIFASLHRNFQKEYIKHVIVIMEGG